MIIKICEYCGNETEKRPSEIKNSLHTFCNHECYGRWLSEKKLEESSGKIVSCDYCGIGVYKSPCQLRDYKNQFCSKMCKDNYLREFGKKGEEHHCWKGGDNKWYLALRNCGKYKLWRTSCIKRDKHKCIKCGEKDDELNVHHIIPFIDIIKSHSITNSEEGNKCEELWDIDNGITLCHNCHFQEHYKNGGDE